MKQIILIFTLLATTVCADSFSMSDDQSPTTIPSFKKNDNDLSCCHNCQNVTIEGCRACLDIAINVTEVPYPNDIYAGGLGEMFFFSGCIIFNAAFKACRTHNTHTE